MSSSSFAAIVDLCRAGTSARIAGSDLIVDIIKTPEIASLLRQVDAGGWAITLTVNGSETTAPPDQINDGLRVIVSVHGMTRTGQVVANNIGLLLRFAHGAFLSAKPQEFYLIDENYASWEVPSNPDVLAYDRALKVANLVKRLSDAQNPRSDTGGEVILFAGRKLLLPIFYDSTSLIKAAKGTEIDSLESDVFGAHHLDARRDIAKRTLIRFLDALPEGDRFGYLLSVIKEVRQAFLADFDLYVSGFSFDKIREEFERRKLDFVMKINASSADALNKIIAIPIAQGLLVSQMKREVDYHWINVALLTASLVFAVIALALIANQINTLSNVKAELLTEKRLLSEKSPPTFQRLQGMFSALEKRLTIHSKLVPGMLIMLLVLTTLITYLAYQHVGIESISTVPSKAQKSRTE